MSKISFNTYFALSAGLAVIIATFGFYLFQSNNTKDIHLPVDRKKWLSGIDVSHYQGDIDWQEVKLSDNISFVYIKGTEGDAYLDPKYLDYVQSLKKIGIPFGAYHFFRPKDDPVRQANHYLENLSEYASLPPVVDIEVTDNMPKKDIAHRLKKWLDIVSQRTGCQPVIYTFTDFWPEYLGDEFNAYRLWLADYEPKLKLPTDKQQWAIWQHSQDLELDGIKSKVDSDYFHGGNSALESFRCKTGRTGISD